MTRMKSQDAWRHTPSGRSRYATAHEEAQSKADLTGHDHGIEANDLMKTWHVFMLPMAKNRCGHELRCEVVHPMKLDKTREGHGPQATRDAIIKVFNR